MIRHRWQTGVVVPAVLMVALLLVGCPKQPTSMGVPSPSGGIAASPPGPQEFRAIEALKDIHFDFDQYGIRPADAKILVESAKWLKANPNSLILIEGDCDERGTAEYNLALGDRRAKSAANYLAAQGVPVSRMTTITYGKERPLCTEHNEECWAKNRRGHFGVKAR